MNKKTSLFARLKRKIKNSIKTKGWLKAILHWSIIAFFAMVVLVILIAAYFAKDLPNPNKLADYQVTESTKIYDRTGTILLYDIHGEEKRTIIPFDQMPSYVKEATLVTEDANFYHHFGIDPKGILRAVWADISGGDRSQGGSTITQQFIKKTFLTDDKTFSRKIKEAILSIELEIVYPKDKIFEGYLNQIPYGSNAYGIEAAAQTFFNKSAKDLTLAQSALLVSLPQAPSYYSPYGSHFDDLKARQEYVLDRMESFGYATKDQVEEAKNEKLSFTPPSSSIKAPHFVMYVKELLEEKYGADYVQKAGLKVYATLDWDLQQAAQEVVAEGVQTNETKYKSFNGALTAADPKTGQILAMVGSKNYFANPAPEGCTPGKDCKFEPNVNVAIRSRQPGSSFKPFAYAEAIAKGYTPQTILFDLPTEFNPACPASAGYANYQGNTCYNPQNYDGRFRGPVTMKNAIAQSLNIPSVKTLYLAGINQTINLAQDMGITTLKDRSRYGLALVLGGGEVRLEDMVAGYSVFAAEGTKHPANAILKIETGDGKVLEEYRDNPAKILDPEVARNISDMLSDNSARTPAFGANSPLYLKTRPAAVKTGTTQEYRDAWTIGYTPSLVAGVWAGNNDNTPMTKEGAGMYAAAPLWNAFMKKAYEVKSSGPKGLPNEFTLPKDPEEFNKPAPIITNKPILNGQATSGATFKIDKISGKLATDQTPPELIEEVQYPEAHNILYYVNKDNPQGSIPSNPAQDPQFANWETPVESWAKANGSSSDQSPPTEYDDSHTDTNQPQIQITLPQNDTMITNRIIKIGAIAQAALGVKQVDFFFDDKLIGTDPLGPFEILYNIPLDTEPGEHTIKARVYDQALNRQEDEITIQVP
jgi:1A family penicillin-binding protein